MELTRAEPGRVSGFIADQHELDAVVEELREIERKNSLDRTVAIGRLVLHRFFDGSLEAWRERRKNKNNSVRRLAQHPLCPLSRSGLSQAIGIFLAVESLNLDQTFGHIGPSHIAAVLHLSPEVQKHWLERARDERLSVRELKENVTNDRRATGERRGRPRSGERAKAVTALRKVVRLLEQAIDAVETADLDRRDRGELQTLVQRLVAAEQHLALMNRGPKWSEVPGSTTEQELEGGLATTLQCVG